MPIFRPALTLLLLLTLITGVAYPLVVTGIAQAVFPFEAGGSLISDRDGKIVGSALIGQAISEPAYFQGRPSATADHPYNAMTSGGSNLAASNPELNRQIAERIEKLRADNPAMAKATVPVELVTASASGLDPHISVAAARWQAPRIAAQGGMSLLDLYRLIDHHTIKPVPDFIGEPVVDLLRLNLALDGKADDR